MQDPILFSFGAPKPVMYYNCRVKTNIGLQKPQRLTVFCDEIFARSYGSSQSVFDPTTFTHFTITLLRPLET